MLSPRLRREFALLAVAAALTPATGAADPDEPEDARRTLYEWTTEAGGFRYTPDPSRIPASRRHTQRQIDPDRVGVEAPAPPSRLTGRGAPIDLPQLSGPTARPEGSEFAAASARTATRGRASSLPSPHPESWAVQLVATPIEQEARRLPAVALRAGERLYRTTARVDGALWSRLRVGPFPTRAGAQQALERLAPEFPGAWITRVRPVEELPRMSTGDANGSSPGSPGSDPVARRLHDDGVASVRDAAPRYAIQLRAIPAMEDPGELPVLEPPGGAQLYWTSIERNHQAWQRLRLGDFATLAAARAALALVSDDFPGAWIAPVRGPRDHEAAPRGD